MRNEDLVEHRFRAKPWSDIGHRTVLHAALWQHPVGQGLFHSGIIQIAETDIRSGMYTIVVGRVGSGASGESSSRR